METYPSFTASSAQEHDLCHAMIDGQLRPNGVHDAVLLNRVQQVSRSAFSPAGRDVSEVYLDQPLPIASNRSLHCPRTSARLIQALNLQPSSRVLVVAAGSGYEAALLAPLVAEVCAMEDDATLQPLLRRNLKPFAHATVLPNGPQQLPAISMPFSHVLLAAPFEVLPGKLASVLEEGARVAGVRVNAHGVATALVLTRHSQSWVEETLFETPVGPVPAALRRDDVFEF